MSLRPPRSKKVFSIVEANSLPHAYAVWTRQVASQPWQFHTAYRSSRAAQKASEGLSYFYDTRITHEGYEPPRQKHTHHARSR